MVCALVVSGVPGSVVRPMVWVLTAPPLPDATEDRDGVLVVTAKDPAGAPVAGATVQAFAMVAGKAYAAGSARGDTAGKATVSRLPHGEHWVLVDAPGRARVSSQLVMVGGERALEVTLDVEHVVTLEVKDEQGVEIGGAELEVLGKDALPIGARTDTVGVAKVGRLGPPLWIVTARATGYEEIVQRRVSEAGARITLRRLGALVVEVRGEGGAPVAGAKVLVAGPTLWPARVAETTAAGKVRIGALPSGAYALRATAGERVSQVELSVPLARGEEKPVVLQLGPGVRVPVRVESDEGEAVAGARVSLAEGGISPFPLEAATDKAGRASLGPIAPGPASLAASADGFVPRGAVPVPEPLAGEVKLTLSRAGTLVGRVVDTRGFPVDGASLVVVGTDFSGAPIDEDPRRTRFREAHFAAALRGPSPLVPMGELGVMPGPVPPIPHSVSTAPALALAGTAVSPVTAAPPEPWVTRGDGSYRAAPVSPGRVRVLVRHPQFTDAMSEPVSLASGGEATIQVVMRRGGTLEGRVVDAGGRAIVGAQVTVAAVRGTMERATRSAGDGTFAFASVPDEVTVAVARADETEATARVAVTVPEGEKRTITITLPEPRPALDARVTDDRGYPIDAAQLSVQSLDPASPLRSTAFTNARGEAQLLGARGLSLRVEARAPGRAPKVVTVDAAAAGLLVVLQPAESAKGEVRSAHGRGDAIPGAEIVVYTELGARHTTTDRDGAFSLAELAAGPARLRVRAPGFAPKELPIAIDTNGGARPTQLPRIELGGEGVAEGVVVDGRGDPVQGARIARDRVPVYLAVGATPAGVAVSDSRGRFHLKELPEGNCTLELYAPDVGRTRVEVVVVAGRTADMGKVALKKESGPEAAPAAKGGVAVTLGETNDREVVLVAVAEASEAERAGLAPGDLVVEIDGAKVATIAEARARLNGPVGDDVVVKLRRGERAVTLRVPREEVRR